MLIAYGAEECQEFTLPEPEIMDHRIQLKGKVLGTDRGLTVLLKSDGKRWYLAKGREYSLLRQEGGERTEALLEDRLLLCLKSMEGGQVFLLSIDCNETYPVMKKYELPNDWNIVPIKEMEIPRELWLEIYGSQNKIIFCEGDKESLDYSVYTILFGDRYSIIPVGSCLNVCKYTEVYNEASDFLNNNAIGIIDFDNRNDDEIEKLRNKKIFVTKFNEIEMLLLDEEIIRKVLDKFTKEKIDEKVNKFEEEFFKLIEEQKEKIVFDFIKKIVDQKINNYKIKSKKVEQINTELITFIKELKCEKEYKIFHRLIEKNLQEKNYNNLLKYCNLKKEVSKGLANKELVSLYEEQAIGAIRNTLSDYIIDKYFNEIK